MPQRVTRASTNEAAVPAEDVPINNPVPTPVRNRAAKKSSQSAKRAKRVSGQTANVSPVVAASTTLMTPKFMDQLVTKVADVVTQRLTGAPTLVTNSPNQHATQSQPSTSNPALAITTQAIDSLVEEAVVSLQESLPGISNNFSGRPKTMFQSSNLEIDARVNDKLKAKIRNNEYVEFYTLLSSQGNDRFQLSFKNLEGSNGPSICLEPVSRSHKNFNFNQWLQAFHVYVGVYTRRFPGEPPSLMKYCEIVQDLASRGFSWKFYDENFRFLRQSSPSAFPWGSIFVVVQLSGNSYDAGKNLWGLHDYKFCGY